MVERSPELCRYCAKSGTIVVDSVFEDLQLIPQDGNPLAAGNAVLADSSCGFSGPILNIRGSGRVKNLTLDKSLDAILDTFGYFAEYDHGLIRVRNVTSEVFTVDYLRLVRGGTGSSSWSTCTRPAPAPRTT